MESGYQPSTSPRKQPTTLKKLYEVDQHKSRMIPKANIGSFNLNEPQMPSPGRVNPINPKDSDLFAADQPKPGRIGREQTLFDKEVKERVIYKNGKEPVNHYKVNNFEEPRYQHQAMRDISNRPQNELNLGWDEDRKVEKPTKWRDVKSLHSDFPTFQHEQQGIMQVDERKPQNVFKSKEQ
ncbi:Hypothetical_protein [Hexamita inflata]|uniref:Hypothetical_protein n=1 Tax=Hexamita inflata TaxID=28002 RepID=A0AA86NRH7_9EUKA|nr:Hypothetical protein HINF_LOCUS11914 [Hexamita inflata]